MIVKNSGTTTTRHRPVAVDHRKANYVALLLSVDIASIDAPMLRGFVTEAVAKIP